MGLIRTEAVVLRVYPVGDADQIVVMYTRQFGKLRCMALGARRVKSRFAGRVDLFNRLEILGYEKEGRELVTLDKADLVESFGAGLRSYRCFLQMNFLAELLLETVPDHEPNDPLFRLLVTALAQMQNPQHADLAQLYFEVWHLKLSGLFPAVGSCGTCGVPLERVMRIFLDVVSARFSCSSCNKGGAQPISGESYALLRCILTQSLDDLTEQRKISFVKSNCDELSVAIEKLIQSSFERRFDSLTLIHSEVVAN